MAVCVILGYFLCQIGREKKCDQDIGLKAKCLIRIFFLQKNTFISPSDYVSMYMSIIYGISNRKAEILSLC